MIESFYADDLVTVEDSTEKAFTMYEKSKNRPTRGGFKLQKWMTNDRALKDLTDQNENRKPASKRVSTKEETYAKFTLGAEVSKVVLRFWASCGTMGMTKSVLTLRRSWRKHRKFDQLSEMCSVFWLVCSIL